jgi:penicillin-binding protein 1A
VKSKPLKHSILLFSLIGITAGLATGILAGVMMRDLPPVELLTHYKPATQTAVLDSDGAMIGRYYEERRMVLARDDIPDRIIKALLAAEDRRFYSHGGFDLAGIARAAWKNIRTFSISQGGSTITQQVARLMFLTTERTFTRKLKEALLTLQIERKFSKDEIITIYLNQSCFGHGAFGIEAAANTFFNKPSRDLSISESALLVSLLKNPTYFSPIKHPERSLESRNRVIDRMHDSEFITDDEYFTALAEPIQLELDIQQGFIAPYFVEEIRQLLERELGAEAVTRGGLTVMSTLDRKHQESANKAVQKGLEAYILRNPGESDTIQAALVSIRPSTGEITAMVGGSSFQKTQFNRAVQARRQPGSAIKPLLYLTALVQGYTPSTVIMDTPYEYRDPQTGKSWKPVNYDQKFRGPVTLRRSLEQSLNVTTAKLLEKTTVHSFLDMAARLGIESELPPYPSVGLGAGEVTLLELTNAYATVAAGGLKVKPGMVQNVADMDGKMIFQQLPAYQEVVDPLPCFQLTQILCGVVQRGTGWRARVLNRPVAGKTGTTNDYSDAWFIGYVPDLVVGVWVGFDIRARMGDGETGSKAAGPIFTDFMMDICAGQDIRQFEAPEGITWKRVCYDTGYLAAPGCPTVIDEAFAGENHPKLVCPVHAGQAEGS